jgi:hypothetical protein
MSKEITVESIKSTIEALNNAFDKEELDLYSNIIASSGIDSFRTPGKFHTMINYSWSKFTKQLLKSKVSKNSDVIFIYQNFDFVHRYLRDLFGKYEGGSCSADKSRKVINSLVDFFITGNRIEFDYNDESAYDLPRKVLMNHDDILKYYKALFSLYMGYPDIYIEKLNEILKEIK